MRADAARNRTAILEAAAAVFASRGLDVPIDVIARRAGVGNATLYRRFPTREDLVEAVFADAYDQREAAVTAASEHPRAWDGLREFLFSICALQADNQGYAELLTMATMATNATGRVAEVRRRTYLATRELIARAQAQGDLRGDFVAEDIVVILLANAAVAHAARGSLGRAWRRHLEMTLDGLRAPTAAAATPALTPAEAVELMRARSGTLGIHSAPPGPDGA